MNKGKKKKNDENREKENKKMNGYIKKSKPLNPPQTQNLFNPFLACTCVPVFGTVDADGPTTFFFIPALGKKEEEDDDDVDVDDDDLV